MQSIANKILSRIYGHGNGWAFSSSDFVTEFSREQVDNALSDLVKAGKIRRVCRGIYDYPKFSRLLQQKLSPDPDRVAHAFARKHHWRIQASGETALNLLGLSTQVPGRLVYLSDGPKRSYSLGTQTLEFKNSVLKDIGFKYAESGLLVQALKALGKEGAATIPLDNIREQLDLSKGKQIIRDTSSVTGWIHEYIRKIYTEELRP